MVPNAGRPFIPQHRNSTPYSLQLQQQGMMGAHAAMSNAGLREEEVVTVGGSCLTSDGSCLLLADMLSNGPMRGSMQQGWGPQGHMGGGGGALMGQGMGPARMLPGMRGLPGSRGLVSMQMMGSGEDQEPAVVPAEALLKTHVFLLLLLLLRHGDG